MKKRVVGVIAAGLFLLGLISSFTQSYLPVLKDNAQPASTNLEANNAARAKLVCDGITVKANCELDGVQYSTYIYHPAVAEKSRIETTVTYREEVSGYCTLCNDGTYSPSCATGRGACSYHGGVAQWNAPVYRRVPEYSTKTVIDTPAQAAYYEKVVQ